VIGCVGDGGEVVVVEVVEVFALLRPRGLKNLEALVRKWDAQEVGKLWR
jgi:hypothetical protein